MTPPADTVAPATPPGAADVFGARLPLAVAYVGLLAEVATVRGLIGPREVPRLWERHVLNSAAVAAVIPDHAAVLDVGSGAGLPGIPLALARPDLHLTLAEPLLRRATFLDEACRALHLTSVRVIRARAEQLPRRSTDVVTARAVAPLPRLLTWTLPLLRPGGLLVAIKGRTAQDELTAAEADLQRLRAASWEVRVIPVPGSTDTTRAVLVVAGR